MKNSRDLILGEVVYIAVIYHLPDFWLSLLNGFDFSFDHMKTENKVGFAAGAPLLGLAKYIYPIPTADRRARLVAWVVVNINVVVLWSQSWMLLLFRIVFFWFLGNQKKGSTFEGKVFLSSWKKRNETLYWDVVGVLLCDVGCSILSEAYHHLMYRFLL